MQKVYDLPTTAKMLNIPYDKVRHAARYKRIGKPIDCGKTLLYTQEKMDILREYFESKDKAGIC